MLGILTQDTKKLMALRSRANKRQAELQKFGRIVLTRPNKCSALVDIIHKAASQVTEDPLPHAMMMWDLVSVIIGDRGRNSGTHFVGFGPEKSFLGSCGFKEEFQNSKDKGFQVQHAMAGLALGFVAGGEAVIAGFQLAEVLKGEDHDARLYRATYDLGKSLTSTNYRDLAKRYYTAVCHDNAKNCLLIEKEFEA
jgi:hypothetical protein